MAVTVGVTLALGGGSTAPSALFRLQARPFQCATTSLRPAGPAAIAQTSRTETVLAVARWKLPVRVGFHILPVSRQVPAPGATWVSPYSHMFPRPSTEQPDTTPAAVHFLLPTHFPPPSSNSP